MATLLVTAVIPAYNAELYLRDAIESVLSQSYAPIECLVIDDGSSDGTGDVAGSFDAVRCIRTDNGGVAAARNRGIREARGDLVAFLDADDAWRPAKTTRQVDVMVTNPDVALVFSGLTIADSSLKPLMEMRAPDPSEALRNSLLMEPPVMSVAQTGLFRRSVLEELGGFDERMSTSADTDLACRVAVEHGIERVDEQLVLYRQHPDQMHLDLAATERDMELLLGKMFGAGARPEIRSLKRRAYANLYATLGAARVASGNHLGALPYLTRSLIHHPAPVLVGIGRRIRGSRLNRAG